MSAGTDPSSKRMRLESSKSVAKRSRGGRPDDWYQIHAHVHHVHAHAVEALAIRTPLTAFSTPVTARHTNSSAATPSDRSATMATLGRPVQTAPDTEPVPPSPGRSPVDRRASFRRRLPQDVRNRLTLRLGSNRHQLRPRLRTVRIVGATRGTKCAASSSVPTLRELDAVVAHASPSGWWPFRPEREQEGGNR